MPKTDPRVNAYIGKSADFARPILSHVRKLVHAACPDVEETIKWNSPFYVYKGILVATPAFKKHCALIFWKGKLILGKERNGLRHLASVSELPTDKVLLDLIRRAVELNEAGIKETAPSKPNAKKAIVVPDYFLAALKKDKKALAVFENFSPSHKREYIEWITQAKREETRAKRIKAAMQQMAEGKSRNWKYR